MVNYDNIITYVRYRKDVSFWRSPFNENDCLALTVISYLNYTGLADKKETITEIAKKYPAKAIRDLTDDALEDREKLLSMMANSPRYGYIKVKNYVKDISYEEEKTFYAVTFCISPFTSVIAFRGTDATMLSWKENCTYVYKKPAPGQRDCLNYVKKELSIPFKHVIVAGHSKGGNLAVYAAMNLTPGKQDRLYNVYVFDGPGFFENVYETYGYKNIEKKIKSFVPIMCTIGNIFSPKFPRKVVMAEGKLAEQHNMLNWHINENHMDYIDDISEESKQLASKVNEVISDSTVEEIETITEEVFDVLDSKQIKTVGDMDKLGTINLVKLFMELNSLSPKTKQLIKILSKEIG